LRLTIGRGPTAGSRGRKAALPEYEVRIPGETIAPAFGLRLNIATTRQGTSDASPESNLPGPGRTARLRNWSSGDRVRLRYSSGLHKVKEVLERKRVSGSGRAVWPVLELEGRIIWMKDVEIELEPGIAIVATLVDGEGATATKDEIPGER
jgi:tRNA(Ile)-lysidine synthase